MVIIIILTTLVPVLCVCMYARACAHVCACFVFSVLSVHTRLFNAYSTPLHNLQSSILNDFLLFVLRPVFSTVCVTCGSLCFCVNAGELMFVSCFELCDSP